MAYQTSMIKDLSIALGALARVQGIENEFERVRDLLKDAISTQERENTEAYIAKKPPTKVHNDDETPF